MTIAYIAESAGVSVPTVSKVLNGRSGVFRELESMWAVEIIRGVERVARRNRIGARNASCRWPSSRQPSGNN